MLSLSSVRLRWRESVSLGRFQNCNLLEMDNFRRHGVEDEPKATLHNALRTASGATGRRAKSFKPSRAAHRLAELITDWSPLRPLPAFARLETDMRTALRNLGIIVME